MRTEELDYDFDPGLVATRPAEPRDAARLMVIDRAAGTITHHQVRDLPDFLAAGDALVLNATRVVPARVVFERADTGGRFEGLVLPGDSSERIGCYLRGAKKMREGERLHLGCPGTDRVGVFEVLGREEEQVMLRLLEGGPLEALLECAGRAPLPPYILGARRDQTDFDADGIDALDRTWYRTVFQRMGEQSSVAAPTAGLHFTEELLDRVVGAGVRRIELELEVGPGTFRPVTVEDLAHHPMHSERFIIDGEAQAGLQATRDGGGRILAVGTTSCRALESIPALRPGETISTETDLLIAPGHHFRHVDALLTNFHLPRSTLLALVAALVGLERMRDAYAEAVRSGYRFYSYGDAMLIL